MREIGIGVLGFGTVGAGAVEILKENAGLLSRRIGAELVLRAVADGLGDRHAAIADGPIS